MNVPKQYQTGNVKTDALISKALAKEGKHSVDIVTKEKQNKYHVAPKEKRTKDGITFASRAEMLEDEAISLEVKSGKYFNFLRQPKFLLKASFEDNEGKRHAAAWYVADWMYMDQEHIYVVDKKGMQTPEYKLKKKFFLDKYKNFTFIERR